MYAHVARAIAALVALLAIQVLPAAAQSSLQFRVGQPSASVQKNVVQTGGYRVFQDDGTLGPPVSPPELMPSGGEPISPRPERSVIERGAEDGEVIYEGCATCNGGCPTCVDGSCYGGCMSCGNGCGMCQGTCHGMHCGGCGGGCGHGCGGCMQCGGCGCCRPCHHGCCQAGCNYGYNGCNGACDLGGDGVINEGDCGCNPCGCNPCACNMCCAPCGGCNRCGCDSCDCCHRPWYAGCCDWIHHLCDHSQFFFAGDGWKNRLDDDDANNFGFRFGMNLGMPFLPERCIGFQFGGSVGAYDLHGREDENEGASEGEGMLTIGIFKRCCLECCDCCTWAAVYDYQSHSNIGEDGEESIQLGQFRFLLGRALSECNEIGFWTAIAGGDTQFVDGNKVRALDQFNVYWRHYYESGADTSFYIGLAESPGQWVFGFNGTAPLNSSWAMFGGVHYIAPSSGPGDPAFSEEVWNVTFGLVYYPHCNACPGSICGRSWMPVLPVADNGSFALSAGSNSRF